MEVIKLEHRTSFYVYVLQDFYIYILFYSILRLTSYPLPLQRKNINIRTKDTQILAFYGEGRFRHMKPKYLYVHFIVIFDVS